MRVRIIISLLVVLLCSCSAEKRMANLLKRHPELRSTTTIVVRPVEITVPYIRDSVTVQWEEVTDTLRSAAENRKSDARLPSSPLLASVTAGKAKASLARTDSGLLLIAEQLADTIKTNEELEVPTIEVHDLPMEESSSQTFFRVLGYISGAFVALCLILFTIFTLKKFIL